MISHKKPNGTTCEGKRSYCEYGVEICRKCGAEQGAQSQLIGLPIFATRIIGNPRFFGYNFSEAQGYKNYGIIQKY